MVVDAAWFRKLPDETLTAFVTLIGEGATQFKPGVTEAIMAEVDRRANIYLTKLEAREVADYDNEPFNPDDTTRIT